MGGETYLRDKETEREARQRGFWERDRVGESIRNSQQRGRRGVGTTKRGMEKCEAGGGPYPHLQGLPHPISALLACSPTPTCPGPHLGMRQPFRVAGDGWCWPRLACRRQLGNIWEFCRPVVGRLKLVLVGALTPQKLGNTTNQGFVWLVGVRASLPPACHCLGSHARHVY